MDRPSVKFDLENWLKELRLEEYTELFKSNKINETVIGQLTGDDLKELGITAIGDRRKLLSAAAKVEPAKKATPERPRFTWQRRRLTICFFDIVGFTRRAAAMDPEDIQRFVDDFSRIVEREVEAVSGQVVRRLGDGLLVVFGWPVFHEDEVRRAVIAALSVRSAIAREHQGSVELKVGIATGLVLVGGDVLDVTGADVNLASRLQDIASPGEILISAETADWVRDVVDLDPVGAVDVKGLDHPIDVFRVLSQRLQVEPKLVETGDLVGREVEKEALVNAWHETCAARPQLVSIVAPPGMGKTRLVQFAASRVRQSGHDVDWVACQELFYNSTLRPILALLAQRVNLTADATASQFVEVVRRALTGHAHNALTASQTLAALYFPYQSFPIQSGSSPKELRREAFSALREFLFGGSGQGPSLLIIEDLHWADPSTLEFLSGSLDAARKALVMVIVTSRSEIGLNPIGWTPDAALVLSELNSEEARQLVSAISSTGLEPHLLESVLSRGSGVPLFLAELGHALVKSRQAQPTFDADGVSSLPIRLSDLLTARVDQLSDHRDLVLAASCIGPVVQVDQLARIVDMPSAETRSDLEAITEAGLMEKSGDDYRFSHALLQDVAYSMLPRGIRKNLHSRVLETADLSGSPPELLARHAHLAGQPEQAAHWSQVAGRRALQAGALQEAVAHFTWALDSIQKLEESTENQKESAGLHLRLAHAWNGLQGSGAKETRDNFAAAAELAGRAGHRDIQFPATYGFAVVSFVCGQLRASEQIARQMLASARATGNPKDPELGGELMMANNALGTALMFLGDFEDAEAAYQEAERCGDNVDPEHLIWQFGHDPRGVMRAHRALAQLGLGRSEEANRSWKEGFDLVEAGNHRQSTVQPLIFGALLQLLQRRPDEALPLIERAGRIADELELVMWQHFSVCLKGWSLHQSGNLAEARRHLEDGMSGLQEIGIAYLRPCLLKVQENICVALGDDPAALAARLSRAEAESVTEERWSSHFDIL